MKYKGEEIPDECKVLVQILEKIQPSVGGEENGIDLLFKMNRAKNVSELNICYEDLLKFIDKHCVVYDNDYESTKQKLNAMNGMYAMIRKKNAEISIPYSYQAYVVNTPKEEVKNDNSVRKYNTSINNNLEIINSKSDSNTDTILGIIVFIIIAIPLFMLGPIGIGIVIWVACLCLGKLTGHEK